MFFRLIISGAYDSSQTRAAMRHGESSYKPGSSPRRKSFGRARFARFEPLPEEVVGWANLPSGLHLLEWHTVYFNSQRPELLFFARFYCITPQQPTTICSCWHPHQQQWKKAGARTPASFPKQFPPHGLEVGQDKMTKVQSISLGRLHKLPTCMQWPTTTGYGYQIYYIGRSIISTLTFTRSGLPLWHASPPSEFNLVSSFIHRRIKGKS